MKPNYTQTETYTLNTTNWKTSTTNNSYKVVSITYSYVIKS